MSIAITYSSICIKTAPIIALSKNVVSLQINLD